MTQLTSTATGVDPSTESATCSFKSTTELVLASIILEQTFKDL